MTYVVVDLTSDAYVTEGTPDTNRGQEEKLTVGSETGLGRRTFVQGGLPAIQGAVIASATLSVVLREDWAAVPVAVDLVLDKWSEGKVTWNNQPARTTTHEATDTITGDDGDRIEIDVTDIVQDVADGAPWHGLRVSSSDTIGHHRLHSSEVNHKPKLKITYDFPPDAPNSLVPSGLQPVTRAAPVLSWASVTPAQVQVQIDSVGDFASPVFDSGWITQPGTSYDTFLDVAAPALSDDTAYYWRVRINLSPTLISAWSAAAQFERRSLGTLTITAPASDGDDVDVTTPTITHTLSGRTQDSAQYVLLEDGTEVWRRDLTADDGLSVDLPAGYVKSLDALYTIVLTVRDTYGPRVGGGDVDVSTSRTFVLVPVSEPTDDLAVAQVAGYLTFDWNFTGTPSYFNLLRDGDIVQDHIDPDDVFVSGVAYQMKYFSALPGTGTWEVRSVTGSPGGPGSTVDFDFEPGGVWLIDPSDATSVHVRGRETVEAAIGESGTTYNPVGRTDPVRVVSSVRGLEGSVTGTLATYDDDDAAVGAAAFRELKSRIGAPLRLVWGARNIEVVIGESGLPSDSQAAGELYRVTFAYWQTGA